MSLINEADLLKERIESHYHFDKCLKGSDYNEFDSKRNDLNKCKSYYNNMKSKEIAIISKYGIKKNAEKELDSLKAINEKDLENLKKKLKTLEDINSKENETKLNEYKNRYEINEIKNNNEIKELYKEISNLNKEIKETKEKLDNELNLKKKEELFKLSNDYKIRLLQYENKKKLENQEKAKDFAIKKKQFEADKEIELNDLKNKAELVKKIITIYKNISLLK